MNGVTRTFPAHSSRALTHAETRLDLRSVCWRYWQPCWGIGALIAPAQSPTKEASKTVEPKKDAAKTKETKTLPLEQYQEMQERLASLEKQLRGTKKATHACKMNGRLEGDQLVLRGIHLLDGAATHGRRPWTAGSFLADEGELDRALPTLEVGDEGYVVQVEKEGTHHLVLNLRVPVGWKKSATGDAERGFELTLPGSAVTTLALELPGNVKEIRWNDNLEKERVQGRWQLWLPSSPTRLAVAWRNRCSCRARPPPHGRWTVESAPGRNPRADHGRAGTERPAWPDERMAALAAAASAHRGGQRAGIGYELVPPDGKTPYHLLRCAEASAESWIVTAVVRTARPALGTSMPIGPFLVPLASRQQGTILVQAAPETLRGQRLLYHRHGEVFQKDVPKTPGVADVVALFQYWNLIAVPKGKNGPLAPLELEGGEKGPVETRLEHTIKLKPQTEGTDVEVSTRLLGKAMLAGGTSLEIQMPTARPVIGAAAVMGASTPFPASLPWLVLLQADGRLLPPLPLGEIKAFEESGNPLEVQPLDLSGRVRLSWPRGYGKQFTVVLTSTYRLPSLVRRVRLDLPCPLGTTDLGAKAVVQADEPLELLIGLAGQETPAPDRHSYQTAWAQAPPSFEVGWRPHPRDVPAEAVVEATLYPRSVQVHQQLSCRRPRTLLGSPFLAGQLILHVLCEVQTLTVAAPGKLVRHDRTRELAWIVPAKENDGHAEATLTYDLLLPPLPAGTSVAESPTATTCRLPLPLLWPEGTTRKDATVRVWGRPGVRIALEENDARVSPWMDRGLLAPDGKAAPRRPWRCKAWEPTYP